MYDRPLTYCTLSAVLFATGVFAAAVVLIGLCCVGCRCLSFGGGGQDHMSESVLLEEAGRLCCKLLDTEAPPYSLIGG